MLIITKLRLKLGFENKQTDAIKIQEQKKNLDFGFEKSTFLLFRNIKLCFFVVIWPISV